MNIIITHKASPISSHEFSLKSTPKVLLSKRSYLISDTMKAKPNTSKSHLYKQEFLNSFTYLHNENKVKPEIP